MVRRGWGAVWKAMGGGCVRGAWCEAAWCEGLGMSGAGVGGPV